MEKPILQSKKLNNATRRLLEEQLGTSGSILIIEPSSNYRESIRQFFHNLGIQNTVQVANVAEARRQFVIKKIAFVVSEWVLDGDQNGLEFCRELRKKSAYRNIPYLLITAENLKWDVMLASEVGVDRYILKPFSFETFSKKVHSLLTKHLYPQKIDLKLAEADGYLIYNDLEKAEALYREAQNLSPRSGRAVVGLANVYIQRKQLHHAQYLLKNGLSVNPQHLAMHHLLLEVYQLSGNDSGLLKQVKRLHHLSPTNPKYALMLADLYLREKQIDASEKYFKKALSISDKLAEAYKGIGELYIIKNNYKQAKRNLAKAISLEPNDVSSLNNLGLTLIKLGDFKSGIEKYLLALKVDPNNERILFNLGQAYEKQERNEAALEYYKKALEKAPEYAKANKAFHRLKSSSSKQLLSNFAF